MPTHTPGPWRVTTGCYPNADHIYDYAEGHDVPAVRISYDVTAAGQTSYDAAGNAKLIEAAPDLLARLKRRIDLCGCCGDTDFAVDIACEECRSDLALIARAEGRGV